MNLKGVAGAVAFMVVVTMFRVGQKSLFHTEKEETDMVKEVERQVKEDNKALKQAKAAK